MAGVSIPIRVEAAAAPPPAAQQPQQQAVPATAQPQEVPPAAPPKRSVVERLRELEAEMHAEAAGNFQLPKDDDLTQRLSAFLAAQHPDADVQITVSSVRRTTTTKQQYETETPGMVGLPLEQLAELQRKLMAKISAQPFEPAKQDGQKAEEEEKVEEWARRGPPVVQQQESVEEGLAPAGDGSIVAKKRAHTLMTSQSQVQGLDEHGQPPKTTATTTSPSSSRPQSGIPILPRGEDGFARLGTTMNFVGTATGPTTNIPIRRV